MCTGKYTCQGHFEILGSCRQQHHQHHDFRTHFVADPSIQTLADKVLGRQGLVVVTLESMFGQTCLANIPWFSFSLAWITGCGSTSLMLCVCDAAYNWSQSPSPDSKWGGQYRKKIQFNFSIVKNFMMNLICMLSWIWKYLLFQNF